LRVLVDTSVWVDFLSGHESPEQLALSRLLEGDDEVCTCGVVVAEVFQGLRRDRGRNRLEELFRELVFLEADGIASYLEAAELYRDLRSKGVTVRSTIDCLIGVLAARHSCVVLARDRDLMRILASGLVATRALPTGSP
jgi:hypothetical protein